MENPPPAASIPANEPFHRAIFQTIGSAFPIFKDEYQFFSVLIVDLQRAGLIPADLKDGMAPTPGYAKWVTLLGEEFLRFIRQPEIRDPES